MTNKNKYISLKLAKQISEVAKNKHFELSESEYYWYVCHSYPKVKKPKKFVKKDWKNIEYYLHKIEEEIEQWGYNDKLYPAFDTTELGEMLPEIIRQKKQFRILTLLKQKSVNEKTRQYEMLYGYYYFDVVDGKGCKDQTPETPIYNTNEAEARGNLYYYLLKNNLLK